MRPSQGGNEKRSESRRSVRSITKKAKEGRDVTMVEGFFVKGRFWVARRVKIPSNKRPSRIKSPKITLGETRKPGKTSSDPKITRRVPAVYKKSSSRVARRSVEVSSFFIGLAQEGL